MSPDASERQNSFLRWIDTYRAVVVQRLASGDVQAIARTIGPVVFGAGVLVGIAVALASAFLAVILLLVIGAAIGYALRSYVSFRRRERSRQRRWERGV